MHKTIANTLSELRTESASWSSMWSFLAHLNDLDFYKGLDEQREMCIAPCTAGRDVIVGLQGNDTIKGLDGNDLICGGSGKDTLVGGRGRDRLDGGRDDDTCNGGGETNTAPRCEKKRGVP
jgi:Ca2+-binding RTX toxin-like protein